MMPNINGSRSIENEAKYLRRDPQKEVLQAHTNSAGISSVVILSSSVSTTTIAQNPAEEALRKITELQAKPGKESKKTSLKQEDLLIFRLGHKDLQGSSKTAKKSAATIDLTAALNALFANSFWKLG
ncbi:MAG: hypothetical protein ACP5NE_03185 [Candidatus Micrarchaeia archaeon]